MTTILKRGVFVTVGAADLAAEKVREIPVVQKVRERSALDQLRNFEPKLRRQADELSKRGEQTVERAKTRLSDARTRIKHLPDDAAKQLKQFPSDARKQVTELRTDARNQVTDLRTKVEKAIDQISGNGKSKTTKKPASQSAPSSKTTASADA